MNGLDNDDVDGEGFESQLNLVNDLPNGRTPLAAEAGNNYVSSKHELDVVQEESGDVCDTPRLKSTESLSTVLDSNTEPVLITQGLVEDELEIGNLDHPEKNEEVEEEKEEKIMDNELIREVKSSLSKFDEENSESDEEELNEHERRAKYIGQLLEKDELWDTDLEDEVEDYEKDLHDVSGRGVYKHACEKFGVVPVKYILHHLVDSNLCMRYHGLGGLGAKALAKTLATNFTVEYLDLSGNWMESTGGLAVGRMLEENSFITTCVFADNKFRSEGIIGICHALQINTTVRHLDLSGNEISDDGCDALSDLLLNNKSLTCLILSRNWIDSDGAIKLGDAIGSNDLLESIDLSWNRIRGEGAVRICDGLKENVRLKQCNLSWNGLALEGGRAVANMLKVNESLLMLDIGGNRIEADVAVLIAKAVASNETLESLHMGNNNIHTTGLIQLAAALNASNTSALKFLSLKDIPVEYEFIKTIEAMHAKRGFNCEYGPEMRAGNTPEDIKKDAINVKSPIIMLKEHLVINDRRLINVLQRIDNENTQTKCVTVDQFQSALQELGLPFKRAHIEEMRSKLDKFNNGSIYFGDFVPPDRPQREPDISQI